MKNTKMRSITFTAQEVFALTSTNKPELLCANCKEYVAFEITESYMLDLVKINKREKVEATSINNSDEYHVFITE